MGGSEIKLGPNPYVGPRPFQSGERLYGRDTEVRDLFYLLNAERVVLLTFDPWAKAASRFWLFDYFPEIARVDRAIFPTLAEQREQLGPVDVVPVPIPRDCTDGFLGAYWRRPHAYLDPDVRHAISTFARISVGSGLAALRADLADGAWEHRYASLLGQDSLDLGYRIVVQR